MARRRLSQQQKSRIKAAQLADKNAHPHGLVVSHQGGRILVELEAGKHLDCKIKSNLGSIVCGDRVAIESGAKGEHRVMAILPRDNLLQRIDGFGKLRSVAANLSQLMICLAISPEPNLLMLDQYLLAAEQQQIEAIILINKIDLVTNESIVSEIAGIYAPLGYEIIHTSVETGQGMPLFRGKLKDQLTILCGVSGVGKSSLINWLLPEENVKTASISAANEEGRHTTRTSRLYHLAGGGDLIDTPGVRGFNPFIDNSRPLAHGFREILQQSGSCRFHNCQHLDEPDCAVIAAVGGGSINPMRYHHYLKLLTQASGT